MDKFNLKKYLAESKLIKETRDFARESGLIGKIITDWHGVIQPRYTNKDIEEIMNAEKLEDLEDYKQENIGRALKRWETESGKSMNVEDFFKAVKDDLTTLSKR
tara:strand:+ start:135 stop:446 length:312 start_codon:yes stop_codon:yes gene_type:complete